MEYEEIIGEKLSVETANTVIRTLMELSTARKMANAAFAYPLENLFCNATHNHCSGIENFYILLNLNLHFMAFKYIVNHKMQTIQNIHFRCAVVEIKEK